MQVGRFSATEVSETMSANRIRKKKPSKVRFNYVQGVTKSGTVKFLIK